MELLRYLVQRLLLVERISDGESFRLVLDPLADDLAALGWLRQLAREGDAAWERFLGQTLPDPGSEAAALAQGFLRALYDCAVHAGDPAVLGLEVPPEVVASAVWRLPLPEWPGETPQHLELVVVAGDDHTIGSPETERDRDWYAIQRDGCKDPQTQRPLNVEAERTVRLERFALARHLITQAQWQAVALLPRLERNLNPTPGSYKSDDLWERFAQPGGLPVESVSWLDCQEWLSRLNRWLLEQWSVLGGQGDAPQLALPGEGQWEAACRAGTSTPFHFGDVLDASWANYDGRYTCTLGRRTRSEGGTAQGEHRSC